MEFCCQKLSLLKDFSENIIYLPPTRSFLLKKAEKEYVDMSFCPFCGKSLPKDLTNELECLVYDTMGLKDYDDPALPKEFKSDEWWKKRGL